MFDLRTSIIELTFSQDNHSFNSIKHIHDKIISELNNTSKEVWLENFDTDNNLNFAFKGLTENELLDKKITKNTFFMSAYDEYFESIAKTEKSIPDDVDFWNGLLENDYLDGRKLNRIFNDILDVIINQTEVSSSHIKFFALGLFRHNIAENGPQLVHVGSGPKNGTERLLFFVDVF